MERIWQACWVAIAALRVEDHVLRRNCAEEKADCAIFFPNTQVSPAIARRSRRGVW
jgi:hypothetical protein